MAYTNPIEEQLKKGEISRLYLLCGEEEYLKNQYRDKLIKALVPEEDGFNCIRYSGEDLSPEEIASTAGEVPFFAERKVLVVENSGFFKTNQEMLADFFEEIPDTTVLIFVEKNVDKRKRIYKSMQKHGTIAEFGTPEEGTIARWILTRFKKADIKVQKGVAEELIARCDRNMTLLDNEMEKLIAYSLESREIRLADLEAISVRTINGKVFEMVDAVSERNKKKALDRYYDLLALKEAPLGILFLINRQYRNLYGVKSMMGEGFTVKEIAERLSLRDFAVRRYQQIAGKLYGKTIREAMEECALLEEAVKQGNLSDRLSVELFIIKYSSRSEEN